MQVMNLWLRNDGCREFVFGHRLAQIAAALMQVCCTPGLQCTTLYERIQGIVQGMHISNLSPALSLVILAVNSYWSRPTPHQGSADGSPSDGCATIAHDASSGACCRPSCSTPMMCCQLGHDAQAAAPVIATCCREARCRWMGCGCTMTKPCSRVPEGGTHPGTAIR